MMKALAFLFSFLCVGAISAQPVLDTPGPMKLASPSAVFDFRWSMVAGADSFLVQFDTLSTFAAPIHSVYRKANSFLFNPGGVMPPKRVFWRVSSSSDFSLFSSQGEFTISGAPKLTNYFPNRTDNRRPYFYGLNHKWAGAAKIQIDDDSAFSSPIVSEEGIIFGVQYFPKQDLPLVKIFWRMSSNYDYSDFSPTLSLDIDLGAQDLPKAGVIERSTSDANRVRLHAQYGDYNIEVDTTLAFASPPRIYHTGGYSSSILTDPMKPGKKYWRVSQWFRPTIYSRPDSFSIGTAPSASSFRYPTPNLRPTFKWDPVIGAKTYRIQVATNRSFDEPVASKVGIDTTFFVPPEDLTQNQTFFWRLSSDLDYFSFGSTLDLEVDPSFLPSPFPMKPILKNAASVEFSFAPLPVTYYRIKVDTQLSFATPLVDRTLSNGPDGRYSIEMNLFPVGKYFWKISSEADYGFFSKPDSFEIVDNLSGRIRSGRSFVYGNFFLPFGGLPGHTASLEITIYNQLGRKVWSDKVRRADLEKTLVPTQRLAPGKYSFRVEFLDVAGKTIEHGAGHFENHPSR